MYILEYYISFIGNTYFILLILIGLRMVMKHVFFIFVFIDLVLISK